MGTVTNTVTDDAEVGVLSYNANGTLDTSFGTGGEAVASFSGASAEPAGIFVQSDGNIVVAGSEDTPGEAENAAVVEFNANGTLDTSFGSGGEVTTPIPDPAGDDTLSTVLVEPDGDILVGGGIMVSPNSAALTALIRYTANGTLDTSFGSGGFVVQNTGGRLFAPVAGDDFADQDHMRESLAPGPLQDLMQTWRLRGEHRDDLIHVPVGSGPRDAVVTGQRIARRAVAEPPQPRNRLPEAAQRPAAARGAAAAPLSGQELRDEQGQFPGDVKRGTIGDHVESFSQKIDLVARPLLPGFHAHFRATRLIRVSAWMPRLRTRKPHCPKLFR